MNQENENLFLKAARYKLRFETNRGHISTEDLFYLSLKSLDDLGQRHRPKSASDGSLLTNPDRGASEADEKQRVRFEIIKEVIAIKEADNAAKLDARKREAEVERLKGLLQSKREEELAELPVAEIERRLKALSK